jgi:hypothetical protein
MIIYSLDLKEHVIDTVGRGIIRGEGVHSYVGCLATIKPSLNQRKETCSMAPSES